MFCVTPTVTRGGEISIELARGAQVLRAVRRQHMSQLGSPALKRSVLSNCKES